MILIAAEQDRPDVARRRQQWTKYRDRVDPDRVAFVDETWTKTYMAQSRDWATCDQHLRAKMPFGHWHTATSITALRKHLVESPWLIDSPINGERFLICVEKVLYPR